MSNSANTGKKRQDEREGETKVIFLRWEHGKNNISQYLCLFYKVIYIIYNVHI